ncbi:MAG: hypothetical protein GWO02_10115 [Gammaproteobacteria bacterium]|nr:hypothetical protein [Gammaproteobacteria bacterium]
MEEAESLLQGDCVGHNYLGFYRQAMDVCLRLERLDEVDRYATALETYTSAEPLPRPDFDVARGRALAAFGRGERGDALRLEIERLHAEAGRIGISWSVPALADALSAWPQ